MEKSKEQLLNENKKLIDDRLQQKKNGKKKGYIIEDKKCKKNGKSNKIFEN